MSLKCVRILRNTRRQRFIPEHHQTLMKNTRLCPTENYSEPGPHKTVPQGSSRPEPERCTTEGEG